MVEVADIAAAKGNDIMTAVKEKIEEFTRGGSNDNKNELPQDYLLPTTDSVAALLVEMKCGGSPRDIDSDATVVTANKTPNQWVSPNKSEEDEEMPPTPSVPSSMDVSPSTEDLQLELSSVSDTIKRLVDVFAARKEDGEYSSKGDKSDSDFDGEYETGFTKVVSNDVENVDLAVIGKRIEIEMVTTPTALPNVANEALPEAHLYASSKSFVNIIHGEKEIMLIIPSMDTSDLGSTLELAGTLAETLGVRDKIVGLKTTARLLDDETVAFKFHGECVVPLSVLVSGQLARMIKDTDTVPSFSLVTSSIESFIDDDYLVPSTKSEEEEINDDVSTRREGILHTESFINLMETSDEFNPFEKNTLLRFGIDKAEQSNILFRASFRVAIFMGDMTYFVKGLKSISGILLGADNTSAIDDAIIASPRQQTPLTLFGLTDFVICADSLFDSDDFNAQQYATLLDAILSGNVAIQSLFDLYHNPDFLLACNADEELQQELCMRDLSHLARKLELLQPEPDALSSVPNALTSVSDDDLKFAINTGITAFTETMKADTEVPQEFINIMYHMFSSGDEMILSACQNLVETNDCNGIVNMLFREWDIYSSNRQAKEEMAAVRHESKLSLLELESDRTNADDNRPTAFPTCLLTAVGSLVDEQEMSEDAAIQILVSFTEGDKLLHDIYDHFIEFGCVDTFLSMLKISFMPNEDASSSMDNVFRGAMEEMKSDGVLGPVEIAALRLAVAKNDKGLSRALSAYRDEYIDRDTFKMFIQDVAGRVVYTTCGGV